MSGGEAPEQDLGTGEVPQNVKIGIGFSFVFAVLGILVGGYVGWMLEGGPAVLWGCGVGFVSFFLIGFLFSGTLDWMSKRAQVNYEPMEWSRYQQTGMQTWDMFITIHRVQNIYNANENILPFSGPDCQNMFAEVLVGRLVRNDTYFSLQQNPPMKTCVQNSGVFEEGFHVNVTPTDNTVRVCLYNQEVLIDKFLGYCDINITDAIIQKGFPQKKTYSLQNPDDNEDVRTTNELVGTVVLSFAPGENLRHDTTVELEASNKLAYAHMRTVQEPHKNYAIEHTGAYGTWATGKTLDDIK